MSNESNEYGEKSGAERIYQDPNENKKPVGEMTDEELLNRYNQLLNNLAYLQANAPQQEQEQQPQQEQQEQGASGRQTEISRLTDRDEIMDRLFDTAARCFKQGFRIYFGNLVPDLVYQGAKSKFPKSFEQEDILLLADNSRGGNGKSGFVVLRDGIFGRLNVIEKVELPFQDVLHLGTEGKKHVVIEKSSGEAMTLVTSDSEKALVQFYNEIRYFMLRFQFVDAQTPEVPKEVLNGYREKLDFPYEIGFEEGVRKILEEKDVKRAISSGNLQMYFSMGEVPASIRSQADSLYMRGVPEDEVIAFITLEKKGKRAMVLTAEYLAYYNGKALEKLYWSQDRALLFTDVYTPAYIVPADGGVQCRSIAVNFSDAPILRSYHEIRGLMMKLGMVG